MRGNIHLPSQLMPFYGLPGICPNVSISEQLVIYDRLSIPIVSLRFALKKFCVILVTAFCSIAVATVHACIVFPEMAAKTRGLDPKIAEWVEMPMVFETCIVFFTTGYYLAQFLARRIGDFTSVAMLKTHSLPHLRLINGMNGVLIVGCRYFLRSYYGAPVWQNVIMICFGVFLVVRAILQSPLRRSSSSHP